MPPKQKISKCMILEAAKTLVQREGIDSVNSRNVAKELSCSTQPIFSQFQTMQELRQSVYDYCCTLFDQKILTNNASADFTRKSYLSVIHLAKEEKNLFRLIYLSEYCIGTEFIHTRLTYESNRQILAQLIDQYQLTEDQGKDIFLRISLLIHGIATLIATTNTEYSDEDVCDIVEKSIHDMVNAFLSVNKAL